MTYHSNELHRTPSIPTYTSSTVIKYMATRSPPNTHQSVRRSLDFSIPNVSRISSSDSLEHERFSETAMNYSDLDVHNRLQELQLQWLNKHTDKNASIIEKMFQTEIQTGRQRIENASRYKTDNERQLNDIHQATLANDELYQQLLAKRNAIHRELFDYQRQLAQNRAESEFLRHRIQMFQDEMEFYQLKNHSLDARKYKLQTDLDEEILAKQVLQMECEVLENEKITNEDIHLSSIDDLRNSIDLHRMGIKQPTSSFREQLNYEVRRMRSEYDRKMRLYRDEFHRKYELECHRLKISRQYSIPTVTREHERRLNDYQRDKREVDEQIHSIRGSFQELEGQIERLEKGIDRTQMMTEGVLNSRRRLLLLEQIIREKEQQLDAVIEMRRKFQEQAEYYQANLNRNPRRSILRPSKSCESINDESLLARFVDSSAERDCEELNKLFHHFNINATAVIDILCNRNTPQRLQIRDTFRTLFGQNLGDVIDSEMGGNAKKILKALLLSPVEYDCFELQRVLNEMNIDQMILIEILLNRSKNHIRTIIDQYTQLFQTTLEEDLDKMRASPSKEIFLALLHADRPEDEEIDEAGLADDARNLYQKQLTWIQLVSHRSNEQMKQIFDIYQRFNGADIEETLKDEIFTTIVRIVRHPSRFFADQLHKCLQSSTINEDTLNRIIISRSEIDLVQIQLEYEKISQRTLNDQIQMITHRDHQRALLVLLHSCTESSRRNGRTVQWKESPGIRFDRNNQGKLPTLSSTISRSQFLHRDSHENDDE